MGFYRVILCRSISCEKLLGLPDIEEFLQTWVEAVVAFVKGVLGMNEPFTYSALEHISDLITHLTPLTSPTPQP